MSTYVIGDIHGCLTDWLLLKDKIEREDPKATFILVGDIIDRGLEIPQMLIWAMNNITENGKYQMIIGNHEHMKLTWFMLYNIRRDINNLPSDNYDFEITTIDKLCKNSEDIDKIEDFIESLPFYKIKKINGINFIITHSSFPSEFITSKGNILDKELNKVIKEYGYKAIIRDKYKSHIISDLIWTRNYAGNNFKNTIIVHGHSMTILDETINKKGVPGRIYYNRNDINVDCGCTFRRFGNPEANLAAIRLEDLKEFYTYETKQLRKESLHSNYYREQMLNKINNKR